LGSESVSSGETVSLNFDIESVEGEEVGIAGYDIILTLDADIASLVDAEGEELSDPTVRDDGDELQLVVADIGDSSTPLTAARLEFEGVSAGETEIRFETEESSVFGGPDGSEDLDVTFVDGSVTVE